MSTVKQLLLSLEQKLDKTDSQAYADILDDEKRYWLDQAADRFVKQRYTGNNFPRKAFEQNQKRTDDLRAAIRTEVIAGAIEADYRDAYSIPLPAIYRYLLKVEIEIRYIDCNGIEVTEWSSPKQIQHDDIYAIQEDPFNKPTVDNPKFIVENSRLVFFVGAGEVVNARITYIKLNRKLQSGLVNADGSVNVYANPADNYIELAVDTHEEVVDLAVKMILENIESQRYQTNSVEITQTE
jgi:hypothetical protein